jgi:hypothetical protein
MVFVVSVDTSTTKVVKGSCITDVQIQFLKMEQNEQIFWPIMANSFVSVHCLLKLASEFSDF